MNKKEYKTQNQIIIGDLKEYIIELQNFSLLINDLEKQSRKIKKMRISLNKDEIVEIYNLMMYGNGFKELHNNLNGLFEKIGDKVLILENILQTYEIKEEYIKKNIIKK